MWRCPFRKDGREPAPGDPPLPPQYQDALDNVACLTGVRGLATCPHWYTKQDHVHRVLAARAWRDKGQLHLRVRHPSGALCEAIDAVDAGLAARDVDDAERAAERAKTPPKPDPTTP